MADLNKHANREDWLKWAIEFMRRGLWVDNEITVHGPHSPMDYMWGEAGAWVDGEAFGCSAAFVTARKIRGIYDVRGVRIWNKDNRRDRFPILKGSDLTPKARRWLRSANRMLAKLRAERLRDLD